MHLIMVFLLLINFHAEASDYCQKRVEAKLIQIISQEKFDGSC